MSEVEVNKISPRTNCGTVQLGDSGDTITIPAGATITNNGTAAGFGSTGEVSWDTTKKTASFTASSGVGYFIDTSSSAITVTLPASPSAGNVVAVSDYTATFATNNCTIARNGSNINGSASDFILAKNNTTAQFIYVDATEGWRIVFTGSLGSIGPDFISATGGTITTCGDFKIHTFTGPGTFTVCSVGSGTPTSPNALDYLVVAGGGSGGVGNQASGAGGGAGGIRFSACTYTLPCGSSPRKGTAITASAQAYPITVGGGAPPSPGDDQGRAGSQGSTSTFSTISSAGGGGGSGHCASGTTGGSGGGGAGAGPNAPQSGFAGNTPPVSPSQGNPGGTGANMSPNYGSGGGGGGGAAGASVPSP